MLAETYFSDGLVLGSVSAPDTERKASNIPKKRMVACMKPYDARSEPIYGYAQTKKIIMRNGHSF